MSPSPRGRLDCKFNLSGDLGQRIMEEDVVIVIPASVEPKNHTEPN